MRGLQDLNSACDQMQASNQPCPLSRWKSYCQEWKPQLQSLRGLLCFPHLWVDRVRLNYLKNSFELEILSLAIIGWFCYSHPKNIQWLSITWRIKCTLAFNALHSGTQIWLLSHPSRSWLCVPGFVLGWMFWVFLEQSHFLWLVSFLNLTAKVRQATAS